MRIGINLKNSILLVGLSSLGFVIGSFISIFVADRFERKWTCAIAACLWTICLLLIAFFPSRSLIYIFGFLANCSASFLVPLMYIFTGETFPTRFRATAVSITDGFGHLGGAFCGQVTFFIYFLFHNSQQSFTAAFVEIAFTGFIALVMLLFGKKRTGKKLSQ